MKKKPDKNLGKPIGYCPSCFIQVGEKELNEPCTRCSCMLKEDTIATSRMAKAKNVNKQNKRENRRARYTAPAWNNQQQKKEKK